MVRGTEMTCRQQRLLTTSCTAGTLSVQVAFQKHMFALYAEDCLESWRLQIKGSKLDTGFIACFIWEHP